MTLNVNRKGLNLSTQPFTASLIAQCLSSEWRLSKLAFLNNEAGGLNIAAKSKVRAMPVLNSGAAGGTAAPEHETSHTSSRRKEAPSPLAITGRLSESEALSR
jgi:hypothetical protein